MKTLLLIITLFMPTLLLAHPGHGEVSMFNHDLEHLMVYLVVFTTLISLLLVKIKKIK